MDKKAQITINYFQTIVLRSLAALLTMYSIRRKSHYLQVFVPSLDSSVKKGTVVFKDFNLLPLQQGRDL